MNRYIITFYTHFGATSFKSIWDKTGAEASLRPVPRTLSASCGVCAAFESELGADEIVTEVSKIAEKTDTEYVCLEKNGGYEKLLIFEN
jgi:hypothetical protein